MFINLLLLILEFDGHIAFALTHQRDLLETPIAFPIIRLAILFELFFLFEHGGAELMPRE